MYHLNIFVSNLPSDTTKKEFKVAVDMFVPIDGCKLLKGGANHVSKKKETSLMLRQIGIEESTRYLAIIFIII
jgi:hypothetical protein